MTTTSTVTPPPATRTRLDPMAAAVAIAERALVRMQKRRVRLSKRIEKIRARLDLAQQKYGQFEPVMKQLQENVESLKTLSKSSK